MLKPGNNNHMDKCWHSEKCLLEKKNKSMAKILQTPQTLQPTIVIFLELF